MWVIFILFSKNGEKIPKITHFSCLIHLLKKDHRVVKLHHSKKRGLQHEKESFEIFKNIYSLQH